MSIYREPNSALRGMAAGLGQGLTLSGQRQAALDEQDRRRKLMLADLADQRAYEERIAAEAKRQQYGPVLGAEYNGVDANGVLPGAPQNVPMPSFGSFSPASFGLPTDLQGQSMPTSAQLQLPTTFPVGGAEQPIGQYAGMNLAYAQKAWNDANPDAGKMAWTDADGVTYMLTHYEAARMNNPNLAPTIPYNVGGTQIQIPISAAPGAVAGGATGAPGGGLTANMVQVDNGAGGYDWMPKSFVIAQGGKYRQSPGDPVYRPYDAPNATADAKVQDARAKALQQEVSGWFGDPKLTEVQGVDAQGKPTTKTTYVPGAGSRITANDMAQLVSPPALINSGVSALGDSLNAWGINDFTPGSLPAPKIEQIVRDVTRQQDVLPAPMPDGWKMDKKGTADPSDDVMFKSALGVRWKTMPVPQWLSDELKVKANDRSEISVRSLDAAFKKNFDTSVYDYLNGTPIPANKSVETKKADGGNLSPGAKSLLDRISNGGGA